MTPQNLATALFHMSEQDGYILLRKQLPELTPDSQSQLIELLKREADRRWSDETPRSYILAGHLLSLGDITRNRYAHAVGLMTRGESLRRMGRDAEAIEFLD